MEELGIINGKLYINGKPIYKNVYISKGQFTKVTEEMLPCKKIIDANKKWVLPGFIDPHVHFSLTVGEHTSADDFYTGSIEGLKGGITTYIDFLDPIKEVGELDKALERRRNLANRSLSDYSFHATIANPTNSPKTVIKEVKKRGMQSIKLFTTYSNTDRRTYSPYIFDLLKYSSEYDMQILVHAEHDDLLWKKEDICVKDHENSRPMYTEKIEIMGLAEMARQTKGHLYIVHVSGGSSIEFLKNNYSEELNNGNITIESCPHYFLYNADIYHTKEGYRYTMTPPLRKESERKLLHNLFNEIKTIGTDHCPFTNKLKHQKFTRDIPMGVGGIRYSFLNMYNLFGMQVVDKFTLNPAKIYGLADRKGCISEGLDGDIVIFDEKGVTLVKDQESIHDNRSYKGSIDTVILRGQIAYDEGDVNKVNGQYIERGARG